VWIPISTKTESVIEIPLQRTNNSADLCAYYAKLSTADLALNSLTADQGRNYIQPLQTPQCGGKESRGPFAAWEKK